MDKDVADKNDSSVKVFTRTSSYHETHNLSKVGKVRTLKVYQKSNSISESEASGWSYAWSNFDESPY
jgi:hypothetical protein